VQRNDFVVNNNLMSIGRPKPANSNTRKTVYAKVPINNVAHLKQQKTLRQCDVGCNSIHKSINNGLFMVLIEVFVNG